MVWPTNPQAATATAHTPPQRNASANRAAADWLPTMAQLIRPPRVRGVRQRLREQPTNDARENLLAALRPRDDPRRDEHRRRTTRVPVDVRAIVAKVGDDHRDVPGGGGRTDLTHAPARTRRHVDALDDGPRGGTK